MPQIKRQCVGKKATYVPLRNVARGPVAPVRTQPAATADSHEASGSGQWQETDAGAGADDDNDSVETRYYVEKKATVAAWAEIRTEILKASWATSCPSILIYEEKGPILICVECKDSTELIIRCDACGPQYNVCSTCANKQHINRPLHALYMWQVCKMHCTIIVSACCCYSCSSRWLSISVLSMSNLWLIFF